MGQQVLLQNVATGLLAFELSFVSMISLLQKMLNFLEI
jgi:hypothetical protein